MQILFLLNLKSCDRHFKFFAAMLEVKTNAQLPYILLNATYILVINRLRTLPVAVVKDFFMKTSSSIAFILAVIK